MNYNFEFNSPVIGRIQPFEYSYVTTNEYAFTYDRDIFSDLRKFNAPIFVGKRERGIFYYKCKELFLSKKDRDISVREDKVELSKPRDLMVNKSEIPLAPADKNTAKIYQIPLGQKPLNIDLPSQEYLLHRNKHEIHSSEYDFVGKDFNLNIYEHYMLGEEVDNINIIKEILLKEPTNILNIYSISAINKKDTPKKITITKVQQAKRETLMLRVFDTLFMNDFPIVLNIYDTPELKKSKRDTILFQHISIKELYSPKLSRIPKDKLLEGPINNLYINEIKGLNKPLGALQIYNTFLLTEEIHNLHILNSDKSLHRTINSLYVFDIKELLPKEVNKIFVNKIIELTCKTKEINPTANIVGMIIDSKEYYTNYYTQSIIRRKNTISSINIIETIAVIKDTHNVFYNYYELSGYKQNKNTYLDYKKYFATKENKDTTKNKILSGFHSEKDSLILRRIYSAYKDIKNTSMFEDTALYKDAKNANKFEYATLYKDIKDALVLKNSILHKDVKYTILGNTDNFVHAIQTKTLKANSLYSIHRKMDGTFYFYEDIFLHRNRNGALLGHFSESFFERTQELYANNKVILSTKSKIGFSPNDTSQMLYYDRKSMTVNNITLKEAFDIFTKHSYKNYDTDFAYKNKINASVSLDNVTLSDESLPLNIEIHDNTIGFILSSKDVFKESNNQSMKMESSNAFSVETEKFLIKDKERANVFGSSFVITEQKKTFIDYYHGIMAINNTRKAMLNFLGFTFEKTIKDVMYNTNQIFIKVKNKNAFIRNDIHITKINKKAFIEKNNVTASNKQKKFSKEKENIDITIIKKAFTEYTELSLVKKTINTTLNSTEIYINTINKNTHILKNKWINRTIYIGNTFSPQISTTKIYEAFIANNEVFVNKAVETEIFTSPIVSAVKEKDINANTEDYIFITKQQYETNKYVSELKQMQRLAKDMEKPVVKTYNWAYVYQYDDPIDPNYEYYGLDELLLPEKDVDYSTFEDVIFDKRTMKPKNPIKILDDNTFIAKYPIKHPTPDYEKTGIIYIDVPTDLMYDIFMKFYQIWYANIFKFGNMSMVDSLKLMLDYIYSYIILSYSGTEYLEPALRVFRQIRWFGETSVMHNAQYKITCEYEDLKSNLQTGECQIENELSGFYVNTALKVLSTTSTSIGNEASIKLYAYNKEDSKISFSISFSGGNVDVYVNDNYVDTIYSNHSYISYELPATDTENIIVLKRSAINNVGFCYVGNIIIEKGKYKNLNIEYDPDLKAGNMPLNDIVNKMVILANMYDNQAEVFEQFRKGNLAISELYKKLENYWELHHANKEKGKRLTIKET